MTTGAPVRVTMTTGSDANWSNESRNGEEMLFDEMNGANSTMTFRQFFDQNTKISKITVYVCLFVYSTFSQCIKAFLKHVDNVERINQCFNVRL